MKNKKQVPLTVLEGFSDKKLIEEELSKPLVPLKFPPQLEDIFLEYHFRSTLTLIKFSLVIGLFLYIAFGALDIAEEIREKVMGLKIVHPASDVSDVVTVSIGVAEMIPGKGNRKEELVEAADRAMYGAKASGRNCVRKFPL